MALKLKEGTNSVKLPSQTSGIEYLFEFIFSLNQAIADIKRAYFFLIHVYYIHLNKPVTSFPI